MPYKVLNITFWILHCTKHKNPQCHTFLPLYLQNSRLIHFEAFCKKVSLSQTLKSKRWYFCSGSVNTPPRLSVIVSYSFFLAFHIALFELHLLYVWNISSTALFKGGVWPKNPVYCAKCLSNTDIECWACISWWSLGRIPHSAVHRAAVKCRLPTWVGANGRVKI